MNKLRTFDSALALYFNNHPEEKEEFDRQFEEQMRGWMNDLDQDDRAIQDFTQENESGYE